MIFRDSFLNNAQELLDKGAEGYTEAKFENTIDRTTAIANPRQIERSIRGSEFNFELIYDLTDEQEIDEDMQTLLDGFKLLELDYLGGSGSRGYGKIKFHNLHAETVFGDYDASAIDEELGA